jgi:hypothetical protein
MKIKKQEVLDNKIQKEKEKREKNKAFVKSNVGLEPVFNGIPGSNTQIDIINGLNYYAKMCGTKESFNYLEVYIKKNHKDLINKLSKIKTDDVTNKGFIIRMIENGYTFSPSNEVAINNILTFIKDYTYDSTIDEVKEVINKPKVTSFSKSYDELLNTVDTIIDNHKLPISFNVTKDADYKILEKYIKTYLDDIEANDKTVSINPDTEKEYKEEVYLKSTIKRIQQVYNYIQDAIKSTKKTIIRKKVVKKVDPNKMVSGLKYLKSITDFKSINPVDIIGKKKLYIWDTRYRKLKCLVTENELGFHIKGTSIINVDMDKSFEKSIKEKDVPALASNKIISGMNNFFKNITGHTFPLRNTRVNENQILLGVS